MYLLSDVVADDEVSELQTKDLPQLCQATRCVDTNLRSRPRDPEIALM